ncbi:hypothetical protein AGMMS50267_17010 [Spirochaetia bacterium]|nr:hypothetical protein AGMMS50267_17010 [Spirochaetia bacterium]
MQGFPNYIKTNFHYRENIDSYNSIITKFTIRNGADLETAYMNTLNSSDALLKVLTESSLNLTRAIDLLPKLDETTPSILGLVKEIKAQIDILDGYLAGKKEKERS